MDTRTLTTALMEEDTHSQRETPSKTMSTKKETTMNWNDARLITELSRRGGRKAVDPLLTYTRRPHNYHPSPSSNTATSSSNTTKRSKAPSRTLLYKSPSRGRTVKDSRLSTALPTLSHNISSKLLSNNQTKRSPSDSSYRHSKTKSIRRHSTKKQSRQSKNGVTGTKAQRKVLHINGVRREEWFRRLLTPGSLATVTPSEFISSPPSHDLKKSGGMGWKFWKKKTNETDVIKGNEERRFKANDPEYNKQFKYADNYIKTSKYNIISFLPQNLFEQFQRIANSYFLVLLVLQFIPQISSVAWYTTLIPLIIVLGFSAIKDAYDDVQRHISDRTVNNRKSYVVRNGRLAEEPWANVKVGDVIRMMSNQFVAADLVILSTSEPHGIAYVETKELDGETNLKTRAALGDTENMGDDLDSISKFNGEVICEAPNNKLDKFQGQLIWKNKTAPIVNDNVVLRGCILKNTRWCYGLVIFAGKDTKLMMNSGKSKFKRTSLDRFLNILILGVSLAVLYIVLS